jgi:molecular chaperone HscA
MSVHVVQGEREMVAHNRSLAKFDLTGIPPLPVGIARIKITFTVDADGLLTVSAEEKTTGAKQSVDVQPAYGINPEDMERMLRESMENARQDMTERLLVEARMEAERTVIELESALKQDANLLSEAERGLISRQAERVKDAVAGDDYDLIDAEKAELARMVGPFAQRRMDKAIASALKGAHIDSVEKQKHV